MIDKQKIIEFRQEGKWQKQISELLHCSESYVWLVPKELGLSVSKMSMSPIERLNRRLQENPVSGCWEFQGAKTNCGYGQIKVGSINYRAHRLAYSLFVGEIPEGLLVCHKCDNPCCCNPEHLFLGSDADNMADKSAKGRQSKGLDLPQTKVSPEMMSQCLKLKESGIKNRQIAKTLGVSPVTVGLWLKSLTAFNDPF